MKKIFFSLFFVLLLVGCSSTNQSFDTISLSEVETKVQDGYVILDVREVEEFEAGHIPNSINKPLSELKTGDFSNLTKDEKYIVICRSGNRSVTASNILSEEGYDIVNVSEGVSSWQGELE